jgi:hypothetical protein
VTILSTECFCAVLATTPMASRKIPPLIHPRKLLCEGVHGPEDDREGVRESAFGNSGRRNGEDHQVGLQEERRRRAANDLRVLRQSSSPAYMRCFK